MPIECWPEGGDVYDRAALGGYDRMRVSTDKSSGSDGRLFTVVVESYGVGQQRQAERSFTVSFDRLQSLMQSIARNGGRIRVVSSGPQLASEAASATGAACLLYTSPSPRDKRQSRMPSSA